MHNECVMPSHCSLRCPVQARAMLMCIASSKHKTEWEKLTPEAEHTTEYKVFIVLSTSLTSWRVYPFLSNPTEANKSLESTVVDLGFNANLLLWCSAGWFWLLGQYCPICPLCLHGAVHECTDNILLPPHVRSPAQPVQSTVFGAASSTLWAAGRDSKQAPSPYHWIGWTSFKAIWSQVYTSLHFSKYFFFFFHFLNGPIGTTSGPWKLSNTTKLSPQQSISI